MTALLPCPHEQLPPFRCEDCGEPWCPRCLKSGRVREHRCAKAPKPLRRSSAPRPQRAGSMAALRRKGARLWSQLVLSRGGCVYCGATPCDPAHLISRRYRWTALDPANGAPMCREHHRRYDALPIGCREREARMLLTVRLGDSAGAAEWARLSELSLRLGKPDVAAAVARLEDEMRRIA